VIDRAGQVSRQRMLQLFRFEGLGRREVRRVETGDLFAVVGLSQTLRIEARDLGVKVSAVCPGFVDTAIFKSSPMLNLNVDELLEGLPVKMTPPDKAARQILCGVEKNRDIIFVTGHAKPLFWLNRHLPWLYDLTTRKMMRDMRKARRTG